MGASARLERALEAMGPALRSILAGVRASTTGDVFVVGGFLRDALSGRPAADLDLALVANPRETARAIAARFHGSPFALDEERAHYRINLPEPSAIRYIDITPLRGSIALDLALRDFTIDSLGAPLLEDGRLGDLLDAHGGVRDLDAGAVRMVSERAFSDDPLRLLRAARIATELELTVEDQTANAIRRQAARLTQAAPERRRDEIVRMAETPRMGFGLRLLDSLGLLEQIAPEVTAARGVEQPKEHAYDVFNHSIEAVAVLDSLLGGAPDPASIGADFEEGLRPFGLADYFAGNTGGHSRRSLTKLAALYHDVAKPETKTTDATGRVRFLGHADAGAKTAAAAFQRLRFGNREVRFVSLLVEEHLRPTQLSSRTAAAPPSDRAIFRFFRDLGDAALACLVLSLADAAAASGPRLRRERWQGHVAYVGDVLDRHRSQADATARATHLISGDTIMAALSLTPGPLVGRLLAAIDEAAATGGVRSAGDAITLAASLYERWNKDLKTVEAGAA